MLIVIRVIGPTVRICPLVYENAVLGDKKFTVHRSDPSVWCQECHLSQDVFLEGFLLCSNVWAWYTS